MTRFDRLMRSSLWFRAAYVVVGLLAVVAIHEWIPRAPGYEPHESMGLDPVLLFMMLIYILLYFPRFVAPAAVRDRDPAGRHVGAAASELAGNK